MKIHVKQAQTGVYSLSFDDATHTLTTRELKTLLMESVKALSPGALPTLPPADEARELGERLKRASAPGLQKLIMSVSDDDMLMFLKTTEDDDELHELLFANMSERKHKMLSEDLSYRFSDGIEDSVLGPAIDNLIEQTNQLEADGTLEGNED